MRIARTFYLSDRNSGLALGKAGGGWLARWQAVVSYVCTSNG